MGKVISFKKYDQVKMTHDPFLEAEVPSNGEFLCSDERVEAFLMHGSLSTTPDHLDVRPTLLFKDKSHWVGSRITTSAEGYDDVVERCISEAEEYLQTLNQ